MNVLSLGLGVNSTAMLVGLLERNEKPDVILFSDTGGERDKTYDYIPVLNDWLKKNNMPEITIVRVTGELLEENCIRRKALPAVAYGYKTCSLRWKIEPQEKYLNNYEAAIEHLATGEKITKMIGIDLGEQHRARQPTEEQAKKYINRFPLIEWDWDRKECIRAIDRAGLPQPGKSSCFFCPNMSGSEIRELNELEPENMAKALFMEQNADLTTIAGLGRTYRWADLIATDDMFGFKSNDNCMACYDG